MRELSKLCRIYCNENYRKWAEFLPHIEYWINNSVCSSTGYTPSEFMCGTERPNFFRKMHPKELWPDQEEEGIAAKIHLAYLKMKKTLARKILRKRGYAEWKPELNEKVLVKTQPDAVKGITSNVCICLRHHMGLVKF
jgi:hypothetical protein